MSEQQPPREPGADFTTAILSRVGVDRFTACESILGPMLVGWSGRGVAGVRRADSAEAESAFADWYRQRTGRRAVRALEPDAIAHAAQAKLLDPAAPDVPLDLESATRFEEAVLASVARIRFGYARPHALLAADLDEPCAPQAVIDVLAQNALPLLVPCHRVVTEDACCSSHYVFGADAQQQLLAAEGLDAAAVDRVIARGIRYIENDGWFCLPTCGDIASHIDSPGYTGWHSLHDVRARSLRACESCRPIAA
jgi:O-6-methylguanine DNA methyltransferase